MTQRRDAVFQNIINNEPGNAVPVVDQETERLKKLALILMTVMQLTDGEEDVL